MGLPTDQQHSQDKAYPIEPISPGNDLSSLNDTTLWELFKKGHEGSFKHIYDTYYDDLLNYGFLFCKDKELIKDSIQDLFIDLRKSGQNLSGTDHIKYYLFKSLKWKLGYLIKKLRRFTFKSFTQSFQLDFVASHETILINNQLDYEIRTLLAQEINQLPKRQKEAIYYFYFEGFSYQELTGIMKLGSVKASRNLIYKAIISLKSSERLRSKRSLRKLF